MLYYPMLLTLRESIPEILERSEKIINRAKDYPKKRPFYNLLKQASPNLMVALSGLRGSGKTTLLLQYGYAHYEKAVYLSLDQYKGINLSSIIQKLYHNYSKRIFLLDEINYLPSWQQTLKTLFELLDDAIFIFTSSISLELIRTRVDLARRVFLVKLPPLNLREYIYFTDNPVAQKIKPLSLSDIVDNADPPSYLSTFEAHFREYVQHPLAASINTQIPSIFENILMAIIERDLVFTYGLNVEDIANIYSILTFLGTSVGDINISHISNNTAIGYKAVKYYLRLLEKAYVIHLIPPAGTNVRKQPKILFNLPFRLLFNPSWRTDFSAHFGMVLEDFAIEMLTGAGYPVRYLKTKRGAKTPDLLVGCNKQQQLPDPTASRQIILEIGSKRKRKVSYKLAHPSQYDLFKLTYPYAPGENIRPLTLLGNLW